MNYLSVKNLSKRFGEKLIFSEVTFGIEQGQKVALIGVNGSGKSTLFRVLTGEDSAEDGEIAFRNDITIGYLSQNPAFNEDHSVVDAIFASSVPEIQLVKEYEHILNQAQHDTDYQDRLNQLILKMDDAGTWDLESKISQILGKLGIHDLDNKMGTLSGGQKKRVALAKLLIESPDFLLLDEPTNHLDLDTIEWLENYLQSTNATLLMVTHDRYFLDGITNEIIEIDHGKVYTYKGNYNYFLEKKAERKEQAASEVGKAQNLLRKELEWLRRQPKARGTKAKYRIDAAEDLKETANRKTNEDQVRLDMATRRQGKKLLEIDNLSKSFDEKLLIENFSYVFKRFDKIGIIGQNGTGKTTFLKMISQQLPPDRGEIVKGETIEFGYYQQEEIQFNSEIKVIELVREIAEVIPTPDGNRITASQFLTRFLFEVPQQHDYVYKLSGGEKRRLQLLLTLIKNPNFLILDEPTNDLDLVTLNVLEEFLDSFQGILVLVSHDRYFMDKLVDHLFVFEGDGRIKDFPGNYTDYRNWLQKNSSGEKAAAKPKKDPVPTPRTASKKEKLSFREQQEYQKIESEIDQLEEKKQELLVKMNSGELDHEKLNDTAKSLEQVSQKIDQLSDRWLELSERA